MSVLKPVSLGFTLHKLSVLIGFFLLGGWGNTYFIASANAQQISPERLTQAKSDLSLDKNANSLVNVQAKKVIASEDVEPARRPPNLNSQEINQTDGAVNPENRTLESVTPEPSKISRDLEEQIIAELNRVRTNPQAYADWLESQKQHYQGMILNFPGEQSLRTNRGLRTLNEAIAFVRNQQPLQALNDNQDLLINAQELVEAIINQQKIDHHTNNLVYNRLTPEAIVMQLVVDDGFPDRRHRLAVFQEDYQNAGVVCQEIEIYQQVCAIAYENKPLDIIQDSPVQVATRETTDSSTSIDNLPSTSRSANAEISKNGSRSLVPGSAPEKIIETKTAAIANPPATILPAPPSTPSEIISNNSPQLDSIQPENFPAQESNRHKDESRNASQVSENNSSATSEEVQLPQNPSRADTSNTSENGNEQITASAENTNDSNSATLETQSAKTGSGTKVPEPEPPEFETETSEIAAANTVRPTQVAEIVESGVLEEGDDVVPNDGSFYDSFPLEGSAGDSFSISLESQDFDTFLAVMDSEGNIIEKNDDINDQTSNSRLEITLPESGSYSVIVNAYDQGGKGKYTLRVSK